MRRSTGAFLLSGCQSPPRTTMPTTPAASFGGRAESHQSGFPNAPGSQRVGFLRLAAPRAGGSAAPPVRLPCNRFARAARPRAGFASVGVAALVAGVASALPFAVALVRCASLLRALPALLRLSRSAGFGCQRPPRGQRGRKPTLDAAQTSFRRLSRALNAVSIHPAALDQLSTPKIRAPNQLWRFDLDRRSSRPNAKTPDAHGQLA